MSYSLPLHVFCCPDCDGDFGDRKKFWKVLKVEIAGKVVISVDPKRKYFSIIIISKVTDADFCLRIE